MGYLPCIAILRTLMGTWVQDLIPDKHAKDSLRYTKLTIDRLAERIEQERQLKEGNRSQERKDELQADTALLIAAGSDGVTTAVGALFFYVLQNPRILATLTQEIYDAFDSLEEIQTPTLNKLPYLHACIEDRRRI